MNPRRTALIIFWLTLAAILCVWLTSCSAGDIPGLVAPPSPPVLTPEGSAFLTANGRGLIIEFETGGRSGYDPHPEWPGGASGVTIGIGYDLGYYSSAVIDHDWKGITQPDRGRLVGVSGKTGQRARSLLSGVHDIYVQWGLATEVFDNVDVAREFANAKHAMPGFEDLRPNCQAALLSLGFNRGWSMIGANRSEMRDIRDTGVPHRDYSFIALQLRKMIRVWRGTDIERGMTRRRLAEAELVLTP